MVRTLVALHGTGGFIPVAATQEGKSILCSTERRPLVVSITSLIRVDFTLGGDYHYLDFSGPQ